MIYLVTLSARVAKNRGLARHLDLLLLFLSASYRAVPRRSHALLHRSHGQEGEGGPARLRARRAEPRQRAGRREGLRRQSRAPIPSLPLRLTTLNDG